MADPASEDVSRSSTPNPRFTSQNQSAEDVLKEQTVGLVHLSDFRKRRAEAIEQAERTPGAASGSSTPNGRDAAAKPVFKKRKKPVKTGGLSFENDEENAETGVRSTATPTARSRSETPSRGGSALATDSEDSTAAAVMEKRLKPNASIAFQPKVMTKASLLREAQLKEQLKKEYTQLQEAVKQTDFALPFVFYDGGNAPGGVCRMKKGDPIWLFLERARKLGAGLAGKGDKSKKDWARISVDDLLLVRGELIIPHHYEFHYFILNNSQGYTGTLFPYAASATAATPSHLLPRDSNAPGIPPPPPDEVSPSTLSTAAQRKQQAANAIPESKLEGYEVDPDLTKVVDRRWYERNKHIYPASMWEEFDPSRVYAQSTRKDALGNAFFFSQ